jgi:hypothetical protein
LRWKEGYGEEICLKFHKNKSSTVLKATATEAIRSKGHYIDKNSTQTLREDLAEYYALNPHVTPAVDVMYADMIKEKGILWPYGSVLRVLPALIPVLIPIWFRTRKRQKLLPFLEFEPLLDRTLLSIRQEYDLLPLI